MFNWKLIIEKYGEVGETFCELNVTRKPLFDVIFNTIDIITYISVVYYYTISCVEQIL